MTAGVDMGVRKVEGLGEDSKRTPGKKIVDRYLMFVHCVEKSFCQTNGNVLANTKDELKTCIWENSI